MSSKIRKQIYIAPHQDTLLKTIAQQAGMSEAEIIRQALDRHLGTATSSTLDLMAWENEKAFISQVKNRSPLSGGRDWQREDLYER
jgi:hypothetical protein